MNPPSAPASPPLSPTQPPGDDDDFLIPGGALRGALFDGLLRRLDATDGRHVGQRAGPYRATRELGRGGMGVVCLGERVDGGFQQTVALKFVRAHARTPAGEELFRRERNLLAALDHAHIARLIDGGQTDAGDLWLAMEFVAGLPIDRYAAEHRLDVAARLRLFAQACDAVAFAHRRLVIHRDIKPANILVSAEGWVKLLDFGVAALADSASGAPAALTPSWASPEQCRGAAVTTASDIYQLGLLLRHLLLQRGWQALPASALGVTEVTAVPAASTIAPAARLDDGELAAIVEKCTQADPNLRYATVGELQADIRARLQRRPVAAYAGAYRYRAGLLLRRHPLVSAGAAIAAAILALLGWRLAVERDVAQREARHALASANDAQRDAQRAQATLGFLNDLLGTAQPAQHLGNVPTVEDLLRRGSQRLSEDRRMAPALRAELSAALGAIHLERGEYARARELLEAALPALRDRAADRTVLAQALGNLAYTLDYSDAARALPMFDEAIGLLGAAPANAELRMRIARYRGAVLYGSGHREQAADALRAVLEQDTALLGAQHAETAMAQMLYSMVLSALDRDAEALELVRASFHSLDAGLGHDHPRTLQAGQSLAIALFNLERYDEEAALMQQLAPRVSKVFGARSPRHARALTWLGAGQSHGKNPADALPTLREALDIFDAAPAADDLGSPNTLQTLGETYERLGQREAAVQAYRRMLVRAAERPSSVPVDDGKRPLILARLLLDMKRPAEAQPLIDQARARAGDTDPGRRIVGSIDLAQARLAAATDRRDLAAACARSAGDILGHYAYAPDEIEAAHALQAKRPDPEPATAHTRCVAGSGAGALR